MSFAKERFLLWLANTPPGKADTMEQAFDGGYGAGIRWGYKLATEHAARLVEASWTNPKYQGLVGESLPTALAAGIRKIEPIPQENT